MCKEAFDAIDEALACCYTEEAYRYGSVKLEDTDNIDHKVANEVLSRKYADVIHQMWMKKNEAYTHMDKVCRIVSDEMKRVLEDAKVFFGAADAEGVIATVISLETNNLIDDNVFGDMREAGIQVCFVFTSGESYTVEVTYHGAAGCSVLFADLLYDLCDRRNWVPNASGALEYVHPTEKDYKLPVKRVGE